jgi:hypothetical protein
MVNRESAIYFQKQHGRTFGLAIPFSVLLLGVFAGLFILSEILALALALGLGRV